MTGAATSARFVRDAHAVVGGDLLAARARRYWFDFLCTIAIVYAAFAVYLATPVSSVVAATIGSPWQQLGSGVTLAASFVVCGLAMYRAAIFTHEIAHRRGAAFRAFAGAWNVLCGIPFLMPSFMYGDHKGHHASHAYGTWSDPEYVVHSSRRGLRVAVFLLLPLLYPLIAVVRFLILAPLALLSARVDRAVWTCASSLYVMNESYRRDYDAAASAPARWAQEIAASVWAWLVTGLGIAGVIPWQWFAKTYLVFLFWIALNQVRTLVAHRYESKADAPVSYLEQLLDTNTFPYGRWLPELWAPIGLRYHALHHLLPMLPYHAMGDAHARLMRRLPPDSAYHRTVRGGLWPALLSTLLDRHPAASDRAAAPTLMAGPRDSR